MCHRDGRCPSRRPLSAPYLGAPSRRPLSAAPLGAPSGPKNGPKYTCVIRHHEGEKTMPHAACHFANSWLSSDPPRKHTVVAKDAVIRRSHGWGEGQKEVSEACGEEGEGGSVVVRGGAEATRRGYMGHPRGLAERTQVQVGSTIMDALGRYVQCSWGHSVHGGAVFNDAYKFKGYGVQWGIIFKGKFPPVLKGL